MPDTDEWRKHWTQDIRPWRAYTNYQYVTVTFNSVANNDTDIRHSLKVANPEAVDWEIVDLSFASAPAAAPCIYRDSSATRRPWGTNYLVLRCTVASVVVTLRLTLRTIE